MTSSHFLKLFMAPCMHKCEIRKENSSFDCEVSGSYIYMLPLCWEGKKNPKMKQNNFFKYTKYLGSSITSGNHMDIFFPLHLLVHA